MEGSLGRVNPRTLILKNQSFSGMTNIDISKIGRVNPKNIFPMSNAGPRRSQIVDDDILDIDFIDESEVLDSPKLPKRLRDISNLTASKPSKLFKIGGSASNAGPRHSELLLSEPLDEDIFESVSVFDAKTSPVERKSNSIFYIYFDPNRGKNNQH